jgi:integrative and conjugative element protein (TIGR02256 family)
MSTPHYTSPDELFKLSIASKQIDEMLIHCIAAKERETGGILVGYYTPTRDCAIVTAISGPPNDSHASRTRFNRGTMGLHKWLTSLWNDPIRSYYLGEWHFHPFAAPTPSGDDCRQMADIAAAPAYHCPEPLLVILGGNPKGTWQLSAQVFVRDTPSQPIVLQQLTATISEELSPSTERNYHA